MPNVSAHYSASVVDSLSVRKSVDAFINIVDTTTLAVLAGDCGTWLTDLDAITDGQIVGAQIIIKPALPGGLKSAAATGSYNARTGQLSFSATGTTKLWGEAIPALAASAIVNGKVPNTGSMATYTALVAAAPFTNPDNQTLTALKKTAVGDRSSRKQQQGKTGSSF